MSIVVEANIIIVGLQPESDRQPQPRLPLNLPRPENPSKLTPR